MIRAVMAVGVSILLAGAALPPLTLDEFAGRWRSTDPALGGPAVSTLDWQWTLGGAFMRLDYAIRRDEGQQTAPAFQGAAYYRRAADGTLSAYWADSNGDLLPVSAVVDGRTLIATWGTADSGLGRTRYELIDGDRLQVTDWRQADGNWREFSRLEFRRETPRPEPAVSGIGGFFFRGREPAALAQWYEDALGISRVPQTYDEPPWEQQAGPTVFAPFAETTDYFGDSEQQWMINLRVTDLDGLVAALRERGVDVEVDPASYPNGRFARLADPEGNPIQLWEPTRAPSP